LVIEAASAQLAGPLAAQTLRAGRSVLIMSVGGLLMDERWRRVAARSTKARLHGPSGALAGLDGVRAMARSRIRRAMLTTRKPGKSFAPLPFLLRRGLNLDALKHPVRVFRGSARWAVQAFPQNINIAAALTLACGIPASRIRVEIIADPSIKQNMHQFVVEGKAGRIECRIQSLQSRNPKTSELAILSAEAMLARLFECVTIGS
jgi:aspartate dehydrogenase